MKRFFSFNGRISRRDFVRVWLWCSVAQVVIYLVTVIISGPRHITGGSIVLSVIEFYLLSREIRRSHDLNRSGWFTLIPLYFVWLLFAKGKSGANRFGPDPLQPTTSEGDLQLPARELPKTQSTFSFAMLWIVVLLRSLFLAGPALESRYVWNDNMEATLVNGDCVVFPDAVIRPLVTLGIVSVQRRDRIALVYSSNFQMMTPDVPSRTFLMRCVGIPGDEIEMRAGELFVNGQPAPQHSTTHVAPLQVPAIRYPGIFPIGKTWNADYYGPIRVPQKGDIIPIDSANFLQWSLFIQLEKHTAQLVRGQVIIDGNVEKTYTVKNDYCFLLGDNRDNNQDSRFLGFVQERFVTFPSPLRFWSWDEEHMHVRSERILQLIH